jgi:hypothetical protein
MSEPKTTYNARKEEKSTNQRKLKADGMSKGHGSQPERAPKTKLRTR